MDIIQTKLSKYIYKIKNPSNIYKLPTYYTHFNHYVKSLDKIMNGGANLDDIEDSLNELKIYIDQIDLTPTIKNKINISEHKQRIDLIKEQIDEKITKLKVDTNALKVKEEQLRNTQSPEVLAEKVRLESDITGLVQETEKLKNEITILNQKIYESEQEAKPTSGEFDQEKLTKTLELSQSQKQQIEKLNEEKRLSTEKLTELENKIKLVLGKFLTPEQIARVWQ